MKATPIAEFLARKSRRARARAVDNPFAGAPQPRRQRRSRARLPSLRPGRGAGAALAGAGRWCARSIPPPSRRAASRRRVRHAAPAPEPDVDWEERLAEAYHRGVQEGLDAGKAEAATARALERAEWQKRAVVEKLDFQMNEFARLSETLTARFRRTGAARRRGGGAGLEAARAGPRRQADRRRTRRERRASDPRRRRRTPEGARARASCSRRSKTRSRRWRSTSNMSKRRASRSRSAPQSTEIRSELAAWARLIEDIVENGIDPMADDHHHGEIIIIKKKVVGRPRPSRRRLEDRVRRLHDGDDGVLPRAVDHQRDRQGHQDRHRPLFQPGEARKPRQGEEGRAWRDLRADRGRGREIRQGCRASRPRTKASRRRSPPPTDKARQEESAQEPRPARRSQGAGGRGATVLRAVRGARSHRRRPAGAARRARRRKRATPTRSGSTARSASIRSATPSSRSAPARPTIPSPSTPTRATRRRRLWSPARPGRTAAENPRPCSAEGDAKAPGEAPNPAPTPDAAADASAEAPRAARSQKAARPPRGPAKVEKELKQGVGAALKSGAGPDIETRQTKEGLLISLTDKLDFSMFAVGSAEPRPELVRAMEAIAKVVKATPGRHRRARPYRRATLSQRRLRQLAAFLRPRANGLLHADSRRRAGGPLHPRRGLRRPRAEGPRPSARRRQPPARNPHRGAEAMRRARLLLGAAGAARRRPTPARAARRRAAGDADRRAADAVLRHDARSAAPAGAHGQGRQGGLRRAARAHEGDRRGASPPLRPRRSRSRPSATRWCVYLLSGGQPSDIAKIVERGDFPAPERDLLRGAAGYAGGRAGRRGEAAAATTPAPRACGSAASSPMRNRCC